MSDEIPQDASDVTFIGFVLSLAHTAAKGDPRL